jgi:hypothetical protein
LQRELADHLVSSNGELEEEVDMDLNVTEDNVAKAAEVKIRANKAFASTFLSSVPLFPLHPERFITRRMTGRWTKRIWADEA